MLLHASNYSLRLYGVDVDALMVKRAVVSSALYAPWMVRPFPDSCFREPLPGKGGRNIAIEDALVTG